MPEYYINHSITVTSPQGQHDWISLNFNPQNDSQDKLVKENKLTLEGGIHYNIQTGYEFVTNDPPLIVKGGKSTLTVFDAYYCFGLRSVSQGFFFYRYDVTSARLLVTYSDGEMEYFDNVTTTVSNNKVTITSEFVPTKDIKSLKYLLNMDMNLVNESSYYLTYYLGEMSGVDSGYQLSLTQQSEESGLLSGLLAKVTEFKDNVSSSFSNMLQSITELPQKIWTLISDGLKNLFVPSEDFIVQYKEDLDSMLEEKLGAVYQVVDITLESWDRISVSDEQDTIELPETTINLPENNKFAFGGIDVKIVPDGFEVLANAIKLIGGICVTILFVNGLRKRYDEVMGVEK